MASNIILHAGSGPVRYAVQCATAAGDDLGLVLTAIEFEREKVSGGRVEEHRDYAGTSFQTFDEPIFIGSAIAQLAGHADAVIVDGLEDWTARLLRRFPDDPISLDAEIASLVSVMKARMSELIMVLRDGAIAEGAPRKLVQKILAAIEPHTQNIIDVRDGAPKAMRGKPPV